MFQETHRMKGHRDAPGILQLPEEVQALHGTLHALRCAYALSAGAVREAEAQQGDCPAPVVLQLGKSLERLAVILDGGRELRSAACEEAEMAERVRLSPPVAAFSEDRERFLVL